MEEIIQTWLHIENAHYNGVLTIQCDQLGVIFTIDNRNPQCYLNVFCADIQLHKQEYVGSFTHIESFVNEYKHILEHSRPHVTISKKRQRADEEFLMD